MRPVARATLSASASAVSVSGLVLGISNTAVTPPSTARARAGLEVLLVGQARLAEMHLAVDHAGQDRAGPRQSIRSPRRGGVEIADLGDPAGADADVAHADAVLVDDGRAGENADRNGCGIALPSLRGRADRPN